MDKNYTLRTGLALRETLKEETNIDTLVLPQFELDGTEEEIFHKLNLQLCAVFARSRFDGGDDLNNEIKNLKDKYLNNKCKCK